MRKLTEGNKTKFAVFTLVIIVIMVVLTIFLFKVLEYDKEVYEIEKQNAIYDAKYEYINLSQDAVIEKKWTGKYYLTEQESNLSYELGNTAIAYDSIKNRLNLYGTFYEVALDGEVTKTNKHTEVKDMINSKIYKIEDRKYLLVAEDIQNETGTIQTKNYLIIVIDKSGNTLLLNNTMDVKTINVISLKTDAFVFDVANEKLLYEDKVIDLKKIIGSTNQYVEPEKKEEVVEEEEKPEDEEEDENTKLLKQLLAQNAANANAYNSTTINQGGATSIDIGNINQTNIQGTTIDNNQNSNNNSGNNNSNNNSSNSGNNNSNNNNTNNNNNQQKNVTKIVKSVSLRGITPGQTYLDVEYSVVDPENEYQVVYISISGGGYTDVISLDKSQNNYRIAGLQQNTDYSVAMGYRVIKNNATVEEITEDIINVKTLKVEGSLAITKITEKKIYFNVKLDASSSYDDAKIGIYVNGNKLDEQIKVNTAMALRESGWDSSIDITEETKGKVTLKLEDVKELDLTSSTQVY